MNQLVSSQVIEGMTVEVWGVYFNDTADPSFDYYEVDIGGECVTLGTVLSRKPTQAMLEQMVYDRYFD
jgi:hypothetical protein